MSLYDIGLSLALIELATDKQVISVMVWLAFSFTRTNLQKGHFDVSDMGLSNLTVFVVLSFLPVLSKFEQLSQPRSFPVFNCKLSPHFQLTGI